MAAPNTALSSLPENEALSPPSSPRTSDFDTDTILATAQLADRSIFVTPRGTFKVERICEQPKQEGTANSMPPPVSRSSTTSNRSINYNPSLRRRPVTTASPAASTASVSAYSGGERPPGPESAISAMSSIQDLNGAMGALSVNNNNGYMPYSPNSYGPAPGTFLPDGSWQDGAGHGNHVSFWPQSAAGPNAPPQQNGMSPQRQSQPRYYDEQQQQQQQYGQMEPEIPGGLFYPHQYNRQAAGMSTMSSMPSLWEGSTTSSRTNSVVFSPSNGQIPIVNDTREGKRSQMEAQIDTKAAVVVFPNEAPRNVKGRSDSTASRTREHVLPGEELLFESRPGAIKSAQMLRGPFDDTILKVFRNALSNELRFHCRVGPNSETYWMKGLNAQLVPSYAYDQRCHNVVCVRDGSVDSQAVQSGTRPRGTFEFSHPQDLFKFQAKLTGEDVVLDISTVKWLKLCRQNSRSIETYSSVRLQLWHEPRSRRTTSSDGASFVTAGTTLSGPIREKVIANTSRMIIYLGRMESYITVFVSDDVELESKKSSPTVKLKARRYGGLNRAKSRSGILGLLEEKKGGEPAGLQIHGQPFNPENEVNFEVYKTFDIEFENDQSQLEFVQAWDDIIAARRKQRVKLKQIQEEMQGEAFTSKEARKIIM